MNTVIPEKKIPRAVQRNARIKGVLHGTLLVVFLALVEAIIYFVLMSRINGEMDTNRWREMQEMKEGMTTFRLKNLLEKRDETGLHLEDSWYLLNTDGYYLDGALTQKQFLSIHNKRKAEGFLSDFPAVWAAFQRNPSIPVTAPEGKFYFSKVTAKELGIQTTDPQTWILVMHVSPEAAFKTRHSLLIGLLLSAVLVAPLLALLGWKNGHCSVRQKWYLDELATVATTDHLTGVLNHRGLMEKLEPAVNLANRRNSPLMLVFANVDGLKAANEQLGYQAGDRVLAGAAHVLKHTVRRTDIVGRLGGDEFIIALIDCDWAHTEAVMARAKDSLAGMGMAETGAPWTISWGCVERVENDTAAKMIIRANKQMQVQTLANHSG
ncbi:MAG: GGDEF domain-containing protein [Deltaproteobacteria bacterium]|nr:GGDEF domain-containing protein [Deltaproteobacteria bacterium]